jgi:sigma-B regulation protein RsbU (phosphoserine phosphatase)
VDKSSSGSNRTNYDARTRTWYIGAKEKNGLFLTDMYADASGRGAGMTVSMPFYDLSNGRKVFKGVAGSGFLLAENVNKIIDSTKIGKTGYAFILNNKGQVVLNPRNTDLLTDEAGNIVGEDYLNSPDPKLRDVAQKMLDKESGVTELEMDGKAVYLAYHPLNTVDWSFGVIVEIDEVIIPAKLIQQDILNLTQSKIKSINKNIYFIMLIVFLVILLASAVTVFVAARLSDSITAPIISLNEGAKTISGGDLSHRLEVKSDDEIEMLADSFNQMIGDIQTITVEKQRINSELSVASEIQNDMMPNIFPKFSNHEMVSLFAKMETAKEVGGDFYDFFYLDAAETKIVFVIADVSGKGVPAALFMVIAKTLIKQQMLSSGNPADALEQTNKILCEDNPRCMFVTALICALDLVSGQMEYANAGHNPPLISTGNEPFQFMPLKRGLPPGITEESKYQLCSLQLHAGDKLYLYTDGINEAMNPEGEQFGNDRFLALADKFRALPPDEFDNAIRQELIVFVDGAEQSDDITTLAVLYLGQG